MTFILVEWERIWSTMKGSQNQPPLIWKEPTYIHVDRGSFLWLRYLIKSSHTQSVMWAAANYFDCPGLSLQALSPAMISSKQFSVHTWNDHCVTIAQFESKREDVKSQALTCFDKFVTNYIKDTYWWSLNRLLKHASKYFPLDGKGV